LIIEAANSGTLEEVEYEQQVSINSERLRLLAPIILVASLFPAVSSLENGSSLSDAAILGLEALAGASTFAGLLALLMRSLVEHLIGGKVFKGVKWAGDSAAGEAAAAVNEALSKLESVTGRSRRAFEPTLVTRYLRGDRQRRHFDARVRGDGAYGEFSSGMGQRLIQCVVYLNDMPEGGGGETMFHHPSLRGLKVTPSEGDCLVFFPAFADGEPDMRMEHSGEPIRSGVKYILNTWVCENEWQAEGRGA